MRRRILLAASVMVCMTAPLSAESFLVGDPAQLRLPTGSTRMPLGENMWIQGLPLRAEVFQTRATLRETSDLIASQADVLPSLLVLPGALLLTWQSGSHHWMVRLNHDGEARTHGTVSVLTLSDVGDPVLPNHRVAWAWLPERAQLLFTFTGGHAAQREHQVLYRHDLPPSKLWTHLHERLHRTGWRRELGDHAYGEAKRWIRGSQTLMLLVVPVSDGSGMLVVASEPM